MLTKQDLQQFTGTMQYHRHWTGLLFTDGVAYMAEKGGAFWLIDVIASYQRKEPFQVWQLHVNKAAVRENGDPMAVVTMIEDTGQPEIVRQEIPYTDFPLPEIKLYLIDNVLLLPSEY
jgi:hypothetical protein